MYRFHRSALNDATSVGVSLLRICISHRLGNPRRVHANRHAIINRVVVAPPGACVYYLGAVPDEWYTPLFKPARGEGPRGAGRYERVRFVSSEVPSGQNPVPKLFDFGDLVPNKGEQSRHSADHRFGPVADEPAGIKLPRTALRIAQSGFAHVL